MIEPASESGPRPYLQSSTPNSIWVSWKTASGTETRVDFGTTEKSLTQQVSGTNQQLGAAYQYHSAQLTGLAPNTQYFYKVSTGTQVSQVYRFKTPPVNGAASGKLRFLMIGDHQMKNSDMESPRLELLYAAARRKIEEKFGASVEESVSAILNVGDQVDVGTLDHYENIHFKQSALLASYIPELTLVGNHEVYYDDNLATYKAHFFYDGLKYAGINSPDPEAYYSFQLGSCVFLMLNTESKWVNNTQKSWAKQVIDTAAADANVSFVFPLAHRPYEAEQYTTDYSSWIRNELTPIFLTTPKAALYTAGHHHLYARGQLINSPFYHMISGGTAWDQYWGQSAEQDFPQTQKTIDHWAYQLVEVDMAKKEMLVESYSIGGPVFVKMKPPVWFDNKLIDRFVRKLGSAAAPTKPTVTSALAGNQTLPLTVSSSLYSGAEPYQATEFQVAQDAAFSVVEVDRYTDFENIYGKPSTTDYQWIDKNAGANTFELKLLGGELVNGTHYVRVRHRDQNLTWSAWSDSKSFTVTGAAAGSPLLALASRVVAPNQSFDVTFQYGRTGKTKDWIGIYQDGQTPGGPASTTWQYVSGTAGTRSFTLANPGLYFIGYFADDGYTELAPRQSLFVGSVPVLTAPANVAEGATVSVGYSNAPALAKDWIGVYKMGQTPGTDASTQFKYTSGASGSLDFASLAKGYYFASYLVVDKYFEPGQRVYFSVGSQIASVNVGSSFKAGAPIPVTVTNGPGTAKDYVGLFVDGATPGVDKLVDYVYVGGGTSGVPTFTGTYPAGKYFVELYINDSYTAVSNRMTLTVTP